MDDEVQDEEGAAELVGGEALLEAPRRELPAVRDEDALSRVLTAFFRWPKTTRWFQSCSSSEIRW